MLISFSECATARSWCAVAELGGHRGHEQVVRQITRGAPLHPVLSHEGVCHTSVPTRCGLLPGISLESCTSDPPVASLKTRLPRAVPPRKRGTRGHLLLSDRCGRNATGVASKVRVAHTWPPKNEPFGFRGRICGPQKHHLVLCVISCGSA